MVLKIRGYTRFLTHSIVTVGNDIDGTMEEHPLSCFSYTPNIGDYVNVYKNGTETMIVLAEEGKETHSNTVTTRKINRIVYALLAILFGDFGIHHFYAGDNARGIKYLLLSLLLSWTVIVPFVIWIKCIIQAVQVLGMPYDENGNVEVPQFWA